MALATIMAVFLARVAITGRYGASSAALGVFFGLTTGSAALLLAALLWQETAVLPWRAVIGAASLSALYLHFDLGSDADRRPGLAMVWHVVPMLAVAASVLAGAFWAIDPIILTTYGCYLWALVALHRRGARHFPGLCPDVTRTLLWLRIVIAVLSASLVLEAIIFTEVLRGGTIEASVPLLLSTTLLCGLVAYALLGAMGRPSLFEHVYDTLADRPVAKVPGEVKSPLGQAERDLFARVDALFDDPDILGDETLTLSRVARRLRVPARSVSVAINQVIGRSFSDLLNDRRIARAVKLMKAEPDLSLLDIMYDAGYGAKSNFYQQFKRRLGVTPAAFRAREGTVRTERDDVG